MANVKFERGLEDDVTTEIPTDGHLYVGTDTGNMYLGKNDGTKLPIGQSDWNQIDATKSDFIKNRPEIPKEKVYHDGDNVSIRQLPTQGYTRLKTAYNSNNSTYINTGVSILNTEEIELEIRFRPQYQSTVIPRLLGRTGATRPRYWFGLFSTGKSTNYDPPSAYTFKMFVRDNNDGYLDSGVTPVKGHIYLVRGTLKSNVATLSVLDETTGEDTFVTGTFSPYFADINIHLFPNTYNTSTYMASNTEVFHAVIRKNGEKRIEYIPFKRNSDDAVGFINTVNGDFIEATQGQFNAGETAAIEDYVVSVPNIPTDTSDLTNGAGFITAADIPTVPEYTVEKLAAAEQGYASSYVLKKDGTQVGATINIPKDMVVSSGEVKTVTVADEPYQGAQVGDKYIDLTISNASQDHIYIPVKDLVDVYTAGNGIAISNSNAISVKIDSNNANGLLVGANGVALATATTSSAGAMSAADKTKIEGIAPGAEVNVQSDWSQTDSTSDDFIKNKPNIPFLVAGRDIDIQDIVEVEYLESTGTQYIDTLVVPKNNITIEIKWRKTSTGAMFVFGGGNTSSNSIRVYSDTNGIWRYGGASKSLNTNDTIIHTATISPSGIVLDNINYTYSGTVGTFSTPDYPILLFGYLTGRCYAEIYYCKIYDGNSLVRDFIPVRIGTTGYMYDRVSGQLFSNSGTGDFVLGQDVRPLSLISFVNNDGFITSSDIPTKTSDLTNDGSDGTSAYVEADDLSAVATSGSYNDLDDKPTIPAAQVNSDWNSTSGVSEILNKPTIPDVSNLAVDSTVVHKDGTETITGVKTFSNNIRIGSAGALLIDSGDTHGVSIISTRENGVQNIEIGEWDDNSAVTISNVATPTSNNHAANKQYVDNNVEPIARKLWDNVEMVQMLGTEYPLKNWYIGSNNSYSASTTYKSYLIPVNSIGKVSIYDSETTIYYSFLKPYEEGGSSNVPGSTDYAYATGYTGRRSVAKGVTEVALVPSDATWLYVYSGKNKAYDPTSLKFTGIAISDIPSPASDTPLMDGSASVGTSTDYARADHVHPSDTSRVPTTRKVNSKALSADITLTAADVGALPSSTVIPTVGTLNTNNTSAQSVNASESLGGTVKLHKVAKTGTYDDLLGRPTIPDINTALYKGVYINSDVSTGQGLLIKTTLKANVSRMPMFHIIGRQHEGGKLIDTYVTFYNYKSNNSTMYGPSVLHCGRNIGEIHAFVYNPDDTTSPTTGYIYIWIPTVSKFNTYHVYCRLYNSETNCVDTITKAAMFDETLVSRHSVITPYVSAMTTDVPDNANLVHLTGNETIAGTKTFTGAVVVPTPTANTHAATKKYIDDIVGDIETILASI